MLSLLFCYCYLGEGRFDILREELAFFFPSLSGDKAEANLIDAATRGAADAAQLVLNITAIVIAFIAFISFLNAIISFFGGLVGKVADGKSNCSPN